MIGIRIKICRQTGPYRRVPHNLEDLGDVLVLQGTTKSTRKKSQEPHNLTTNGVYLLNEGYTSSFSPSGPRQWNTWADPSMNTIIKTRFFHWQTACRLVLSLVCIQWLLRLPTRVENALIRVNRRWSWLFSGSPRPSLYLTSDPPTSFQVTWLPAWYITVSVPPCSFMKFVPVHIVVMQTFGLFIHKHKYGLGWRRPHQAGDQGGDLEDLGDDDIALGPHTLGTIF